MGVIELVRVLFILFDVVWLVIVLLVKSMYYLDVLNVVVLLLNYCWIGDK